MLNEASLGAPLFPLNGFECSLFGYVRLLAEWAAFSVAIHCTSLRLVSVFVASD